MTGLEQLFAAVALVANGLLGVSSFIVRKRPEAEKLIRRLAKISGWIGLASAVYAFWLFLAVLRIPMTLLGLLSTLATSVVLAALGFLFGFGMVLSHLSREARRKAMELRRKLSLYQQSFGWAALGLAAWWVMLWIA